MFDYNSKRWRKKRAAILRKYGGLCQESLRYGKRRQATTVHHVWPVSEHPEYAWADWNLLPLTAEKHDAMHDRENDKLTALGESWKKRCIPPSQPAEN